MRTLYMHIGHGKTGTSFIQSVLAKSIDNLAVSRITYPIFDSDMRLGVEGKISSGNARGALETLESLDAWLAKNTSETEDSILMSSEYLFVELHALLHRNVMPLHRDDIETLIRKKGFDRVKILLYLRNPEILYSSGWQQHIKRGGETRPIEALEHEIGFRYIKYAAQMITTFKNSDFFKLTLVNYDATKDIITQFARWVEVSEEQFIRPSMEIINRSLTVSELELVRIFNEVLKSRQLSIRPATLLSDTLCNELPDIKAEHSKLPRDLADRLWSGVSDSISIINKNISWDQKIVRVKDNSHNSLPHEIKLPSYSFSAQQIRAIVNFMCEQITIYELELEAVGDKLERALPVNVCPPASLATDLGHNEASIGSPNGKSQAATSEISQRVVIKFHRQNTILNLLKFVNKKIRACFR